MPSSRQIPLRALVPSALTVMGLCAGATAIRFAIAEQWEFAVGAIFLAAIFDTIDGSVARLLKGTSRFGAALDSLSDIISFGIAPAVVLFLWDLAPVKGLGWAAALVYLSCCAMRLARFNVSSAHMEESGETMRVFHGVPSPAGAAIALLPMTFAFAVDWPVLAEAPLAMASLVGAGMLMVAPFATPSLRALHVQRAQVIPVILGLVVFAGLMSSFFWLSLALLTGLYLLSLPVFMVWHRRKAGQK